MTSYMFPHPKGSPMILLNPVLGGKIRGALVTLFAVFMVVTQFWPELNDEGWVGTVIKVYGAALAVIEILTHGTEVGNAPPFGD